MKKLVLAEKPSVGKEIARVLKCNQKRGGFYEGPDYVVTWALGHLVTLADPDTYDTKYANWHIDDLPIMPDHLKTVVIKRSGKQYSTVKAQVNRSDINEIIIATDAGREGELVARWILQKCKTKKPIKRLWISSVTDKAIQQGFRQLKPGKDYENLFHAAVARSEGDWFVGINATRALTTKYNTPLSCGRVQTPTLAIIEMRENEIRQFRPKKYYGMTAQTNDLTLKWHTKNNDTKVFDENIVNQLLKSLKGENAKVAALESKHKKKFASHLYDLTELQRDAHHKYGYTPKQTLSFMQKLYEHHKALTYPRTDSRYLTSDLVETLSERLRSITMLPYRQVAFKLTKSPIKGGKHFVDDKKVTDHHSIIPTEENIQVSDLSYEERNIYELVVKRFLEVLMPPFEYEETTVEVKIGNEMFSAKGKRIMKLGWKELSSGDDKDQLLPLLKKGDNLKINQLTKTNGETQPPSYFNEATLLTAMENPAKYMQTGDQSLKNVLGQTGGLGTVATRADIIEKLFNTEVMVLKGKSLHITNKGRQLLSVAPKELKSPKLTAEWEIKLNDIATGKGSYKAFVNEMKSYTRTIVDDIKGSSMKFKHDNLTTTKCPECGKLMMSVKTKHGKSLVCLDRSCGHRMSISKVTNARCPECHKKLELRGTGDSKVFTCKCGYKEKLSSFEKRKATQTKGGGKKDYINYMKKQEKLAAESKKANNPFAALSKLNVKDK